MSDYGPDPVGSSEDDPIDRLRNTVQRMVRHNHGHIFNYANVADYAEQSAAMQHNRRRQEAHVDAILKARCPDYKPPDENSEGMGTFINAGIMADSKALQQWIASHTEGGGQQPAQPDGGQQPQRPRKSLFRRLLPWMIGLTLAGVGGALVANYLGDEDTRNEFDLRAREFDADQQPIR